MSCGRYVSTGYGPVSSAVGMLEPVTITRSASATPTTPGACAAAVASQIKELPAAAKPATHQAFGSRRTFISDPKGSDGAITSDFTRILQLQLGKLRQVT